MRGRRRPSYSGGSGTRALRHRAILADDSGIALELIGEALESAGFAVIKYPSTIGLRAAILREQPAVVVIDVQIPPLNGADTVRAMKLHPQLKAIPVLLYSEEVPNKIEQIAKECGADAWCTRDAALIALKAAALVLRRPPAKTEEA